MSLSETGLWLLPLLLVATLAALILFTRHWRKATHGSLSQLRAQLRQLEATYKGLLQQADRFPVDSPEPYNKPAQSIHSMLDSLEGDLAEFKNGYIALQDKLHELNQNRFRALVAAPFLWNELYQDTNRLIQQTGAINNHQQEAQTNLDELQRIPLQVASQARTAYQLQASVRDRLNELHANHVHGAAMDKALEESKQWEAAFKELPAFYLDSDESDLLQQATLPLTTQTYNLALRAQPALLTLDACVEEWQNQHQEAVRQVGQLQTLLGALQNLFSEMPAALNLSDLLAQFEQMQVIAQNLEATLERLEIESAPNLIAETLHQQQIASGLERELRQARQQLGSLNKTLPDLDKALKLLREQFDDLVASPVHPLRWGASWSVLDEQHQKAAALTQQTAPYTPEQVWGNLEAATQLLVEVKLLDQKVRSVTEQHDELLKLLSSPELNQEQRWLDGARSLVDKIAVYDPINWPRLDGVSHLQADLQEFTERLKLLIKDKGKKSLSEEEVTSRLEEARQVAARSTELRARSLKIQSRLDDILALEQQCRQQLDEASRTIAQITALERSNSALSKIVHSDLGRMQSSLEQAQTELEQRYRGSIEKKVRVTETFYSRLEQSLQQWQAHFEKELEGVKLALAEQLTSLQNITELDEPAVEAAKQLLASPAAHSTGKAGSGYESSQSEIVLQLKRGSEFWQSCQAARSALSDVAQPVVELFQEASRHRTNARQMLTNQPVSMEGSKNWSPGSISLESETQEFARLEGTWNALRSQPVRAMALVNQLGKLAARYEGLADRIQQTADKATQAQAQLAQLRSDLDELAAKWENLWQAYRDNPVTAEEIRKLLAEIDGERDQLQRQFRQGERSFGEVIHSLQQLQRRARLTQVMIDERTALDINGRIIPYK